MKISRAILPLCIVLFIVIAAPLIVHAQNSYTVPSLPFWAPNGLVTCTGLNYIPSGSGNANLSSLPPCQSLCDLINTIINIVYFMMTIAIFILVPVFLVVGGIMLMMGGANPGMLESGKKTLKGTVIGLVVLLCSYLIISTFITFMNITGIGGFNGNSACTPPPSSMINPLISIAYAQTKISPVLPVPNAYATSTGPAGFVANFYQLALMLSGVLAFGAIVYGGVRYVSAAGNPSAQEDGKKWIEGALLGLLLLAGAYIVLNVIDPDLVNLNIVNNINLQAINIPGGGGPVTPGGGGGATGVGGGGAADGTGCAGGQCVSMPNCTVVPPSPGVLGVNCGGAPSMLSTLDCISAKDPTYNVSEGYPATADRTGISNQCHNTGCCVDTTVPGGSCAAVQALESAATACGATYVNEYSGCGGKTYGVTTGGNLHINSSAASKNGSSC